MEPAWKQFEGGPIPDGDSGPGQAGAARPSPAALLQCFGPLVAEIRHALSNGKGGAVAPAHSGAPTDVTAELERVRAGVDLLAREHEGMADELLRVYEQVGIVFEVTRRLAEVRDEQAVVHLFIDSLRRTYQHIRFGVTTADELRQHTVGPSELIYKAWVEQAVEKARRERNVVVENRRPAADHGGAAEEGTAVQVLVGPVFAGDEFVCGIVLANDQAERSFDSSDMLLLDSLSIFCGDLIRNFRLLQQLRQLSIDMVRALVGAVDQKDQYTSGHSNRVGRYATLLGTDLGLDAETLQMLEWSALLHDVGKIGIRDEVLKKPARLTDEEFAHIKEHPVRSFEVVKRIPQLAAALDGVLYHHEHYDGSGYPSGLAGEQIPLQARIIQIADVFDALTTSRSYRGAFSWEKALSILREEAGTTVDPQLAERFERLIRQRVAADPDAVANLCAPWWPYTTPHAEAPTSAAVAAPG